MPLPVGEQMKMAMQIAAPSEPLHVRDTQRLGVGGRWR
jgi:hypothetical protein